MTCNKFRFLAPIFALLIALLPAAATHADSTAPEVAEVRTDAFPRVTVRLTGPEDMRLWLGGLTPDRLRVKEDGQLQGSVDLVQVRDPATPTSVALVLDVSRGMADERKLMQAQATAKSFTEQMRSWDRIALLSFGDLVNVPQPLTRDRRLLAGAIDKLAAGGNTTRLYDAVAQGLTQLSLAPDGARALVVLTDDVDTVSERTVEDDVAQAVRAAVPVYAIGLGSGADSDVLQRLAASTGGRYYHVQTGQDLGQVIRLITRQLTSDYEVSWLSSAQAVAGQDVSVQISIEPLSQASSPATLSFTYAPPALDRADRSVRDNQVQLVELAPSAAPSQGQVTAAGLLAGASALLLFFGLVGRRVNRRLQARLTTYVAGRPELVGPTPGTVSIVARRARLDPLTTAAARLTARIVPDKQLQRLRRKLIQAGYPSDKQISVFLAAELALAVLLGITAYELLVLRGLAQRSPFLVITIAGVAAVFGMYLPYMWLRRRVESRQRRLLRALPDALDLMAVAVSAGLSLDSAMSEVVQKWEGELSRELNQVLNEMRMGASRREALRNLADRTQLQDLQLLVASLLQADELGANVSDTLSVQAEQLRIRRRQAAEDKARKAPVKMLVPLVMCIFPAMFVVILAPAILQFLSIFRSLGHHG